ncbi:hypothetical protein [Vibrio taketomensis]|uniref:hypothetical protein n=1 Tax=Vibrio taketomensis TaxID=2572923 RepID=UPI00138A0C3D|nr:hypothetical protein [Vibrio taketomensis]
MPKISLSDIDAQVNNAELDIASGKMKVHANSEADILSVALSAGVSKETSPDFDTKVGVSVAVAVGYNK